ncbi:MAG: hypothetical protein VKL39_00860 [Leptolyngbyaceae bacterium]|nr:hypothetical protein [Leptolyngbyaceae bacterium]
MVLATVIVVVTVLVAWALRLMRNAIEQREFSLMLAGLLVSSAAAGLIGVYFLMSSCFSYMTAHAYPSDFSVQELGAQDWNRAFLYDATELAEQKFRKS